MRIYWLTIAALLFSACVSHAPPIMPQALSIHSFRNGLAGAHANSSSVTLRVAADSSSEKEDVLLVDYPAPSGDPASRDVRLDAERTNWSAGKAISFRARPASAIRLTVSFIDRNGVVYTSWTNLQAGVWQPVRIELAAIRPNQYFQPPGAKMGAPLDVTEVKFLAFAPQDRQAGRIALAQIILTN
jgi:hypothetical protein